MEKLNTLTDRTEFDSTKNAAEIPLSEKELRGLFEFFPLGIVVADMDGKLLEFNEAFRRISGYPANELIALNYQKLIADHYSADYATQFELLKIAGCDGPRENEFKCKNGTFTPVRIQRVILEGADGTPRIWSIVEDVSEQKHCDERAKANLQRFELAASSANLGVWEWDIVNNTMFWDDRILKIYGYTRETLPRGIEAWRQRVAPNDQERLWEECQSALRGDREWDIEFPIMLPNGERRYIKGDAIVLRDQAGNPIRMVGINQDITDRKRAEEELAKRWLIMEQAPVTIVITNRQGIIEYVNPCFSRLTGYNAEEAIGQNPRIFKSGLHDKNFYKNLWKTILSSCTWRGEILNKKKDGSTYWEQAIISPIANDFGEITHFVAVKEDITAQKNLEKLREDVERIARHDLKTPLVGIIGLPQTMMDDYNLTEKQRELLKMIENSGYRMLDMINMSLDFLQMEQGTYNLKAKIVDLLQVVRRVEKDLSSMARRKKIIIRVVLEGEVASESDSYWIMGDDLLCYSVFSNLIKNALESSPDHEVVIVSFFDREECSISIHNFGVVPTVIREQFFDKYCTSGKPGGTGLGTYSAKLMIKTMGGDVALDTAREGATTVTVRLPKP